MRGESSRDYKTRDSWKKNDKRDTKYRIEELGCPRLRLDTRKKRFLRKNYKKEQWICDKNVYRVICNSPPPDPLVGLSWAKSSNQPC